MSIFDEEYDNGKKPLVLSLPNYDTNQQTAHKEAGGTKGMFHSRGDEGVVSPGPNSRLEPGRGYSGGTVGADGVVWR